MKTLSSKQKVKLAVEASLNKKAEDVIALDMRKISNIADYFVIVSGSSATRIDTIADNIAETMRNAGCLKPRREGRGDSLWVVLDFNDCVIHVFHNEARRFYNLERLWRDAKVVKVNDIIPGKSTAKRAVKKRK